MIVSGTRFESEIGYQSDDIVFDFNIDFKRDKNNNFAIGFDGSNDLMTFSGHRIMDAQSNFLYSYRTDPVHVKGIISRSNGYADYNINNKLYSSQITINNAGQFTGFYIDAADGYIDINARLASKNPSFITFSNSLYYNTGNLSGQIINPSGTKLNIYNITFNEESGVSKNQSLFPLTFQGAGNHSFFLEATDPPSGETLDLTFETNYGNLTSSFSFNNPAPTGIDYNVLNLSGPRNLYISSGTGIPGIFAVTFDSNETSFSDLEISLSYVAGSGYVSGLFSGVGNMSGFYSGNINRSGFLYSTNATGHTTFYNNTSLNGGPFSNAETYVGRAVTSSKKIAAGTVQIPYSIEVSANIERLETPNFRAASFSGQTTSPYASWLEAEDSSILTFGDEDRSFAGWFYYPANYPSQNLPLLGKRNQAISTLEYWAEVLNTNQIRYSMYDGASSDQTTSSNTFTKGAWNFAAFGYSRVEKKNWVYLNGVLTTGLYGIGAPQSGTISSFNIGARGSNWAGDGTVAAAYTGEMALWGQWNQNLVIGTDTTNVDILYNNGTGALKYTKFPTALRTGLGAFWELGDKYDELNRINLRQGSPTARVVFTGIPPTLDLGTSNTPPNTGAFNSGSYYAREIGSPFPSGLVTERFYSKVSGLLSFNTTTSSGGRITLEDYEITAIPEYFVDISGRLSGNPDNIVFTGIFSYDRNITGYYNEYRAEENNTLYGNVFDGYSTFKDSWKLGYSESATGTYTPFNYTLPFGYYSGNYSNLTTGANTVYLKVDYFNNFQADTFQESQLKIQYGSKFRTINITGSNYKL